MRTSSVGLGDRSHCALIHLIRVHTRHHLSRIKAETAKPRMRRAASKNKNGCCCFVVSFDGAQSSFGRCQTKEGATRIIIGTSSVWRKCESISPAWESCKLSLRLLCLSYSQLYVDDGPIWIAPFLNTINALPKECACNANANFITYDCGKGLFSYKYVHIYVHIYEELFFKTQSVNLALALPPRYFDWRLFWIEIIIDMHIDIYIYIYIYSDVHIHRSRNAITIK